MRKCESYKTLLKKKKKKKKKKNRNKNNTQYNISLLPSVNTIARGMICGDKYTHHIFTPVIKL